MMTTANSLLLPLFWGWGFDQICLLSDKTDDLTLLLTSEVRNGRILSGKARLEFDENTCREGRDKWTFGKSPIYPSNNFLSSKRLLHLIQSQTWSLTLGNTSSDSLYDVFLRLSGNFLFKESKTSYKRQFYWDMSFFLRQNSNSFKFVYKKREVI